MTKLLRHKDTGEVYPLNASLIKHDNMEVIEVPSNKPLKDVLDSRSGNAKIDDPVQAVTAPVEEPAPKTKARSKAKKKSEDISDLVAADEGV